MSVAGQARRPGRGSASHRHRREGAAAPCVPRRGRSRSARPDSSLRAPARAGASDPIRQGWMSVAPTSTDSAPSARESSHRARPRVLASGLVGSWSFTRAICPARRRARTASSRTRSRSSVRPGHEVSTVVRQVDVDRSQAALARDVVWSRSAVSELEGSHRTQRPRPRPLSQPLPCRLAGRASRRPPRGPRRGGDPSQLPLLVPQRHVSQGCEDLRGLRGASSRGGESSTAAIEARARRVPCSRRRSRFTACSTP